MSEGPYGIWRIVGETWRNRGGIAEKQCEKWGELLANRGGSVGESWGESWKESCGYRGDIVGVPLESQGNRGVNHGGIMEDPWGIVGGTMGES